MNPGHSAVLSSWKEIAAYLGKGVRTVQRWERELALPVRRPVAHNKRIVIAVPDELNTWLKRQLAPGGNTRRGDAALRHAEMERMHRLLAHMAEEMRKVRARSEHLLELLAISRMDRGARAETRARYGVRGDENSSESSPDDSPGGKPRRK